MDQYVSFPIAKLEQTGWIPNFSQPKFEREFCPTFLHSEFQISSCPLLTGHVVIWIPFKNLSTDIHSLFFFFFAVAGCQLEQKSRPTPHLVRLPRRCPQLLLRAPDFGSSERRSSQQVVQSLSLLLEVSHKVQIKVSDKFLELTAHVPCCWFRHLLVSHWHCTDRYGYFIISNLCKKINNRYLTRKPQACLLL